MKQIILPNKVKYLIKKLNKSGYEAYAVGGCVRDSLLGKEPNDWDICTSAKPEQIKSCFSDHNMFDAGMKHGTISVVLEKEIFEITTYRIDGEYSDNRRPDSVTFTSDIVEDLARRDFTINAMAYNEADGLKDPFDGQLDLSRGLIRCVGDADKRFNEDALRIMRALRFASTFGFEIAPETSEAVLNNRQLLDNIAKERICTELLKLLCGDSVYKILNTYRSVIAQIIPEVSKTFDYDQSNPHHSRDLWDHIIYAVHSIKSEPELRMSMLLHDLGKPDTCRRDKKGISHFYGHQEVSADIASVVLHRLKCSSEFIRTCVMLIKYHDIRFDGNIRHIRRMLKTTGEDVFRKLMLVQQADLDAQSPTFKFEEKQHNLNLSIASFNKIIENKMCFSMKQLAVNGRDMIELGITDGKRIGTTLDYLLEKVIEGKFKNDKEILLNMAKIYNHM